MNLDKDPSSWARVNAEAVLSGSEAQRINVLNMAKHDIAAMDDEIRKMRGLLFMVAPSHQGGHSDTGAAIAECLGVPFPISVPDLERAAKAEGFDPKEFWPWLYKMRAMRGAG